VNDESEDPPSLTPWERETVAWMEEELGLRDPGLPGRAGRMPLAGAMVSLFGMLVALTAQAPLGVAGWIVVLIGLVIVWDRS
jgi:hypothetical protein